MGIRTRHTVAGAIDPNTPEHYLNHPVFGKYLERVDEDAKPFTPELHKPRTAKVETPEVKAGEVSDRTLLEVTPLDVKSTAPKNKSKD